MRASQEDIRHGNGRGEPISALKGHVHSAQRAGKVVKASAFASDWLKKQNFGSDWLEFLALVVNYFSINATETKQKIFLTVYFTSACWFAVNFILFN